MVDVKRCSRCGAVISDINNADWYSHLRIKYCTECAKDVKREKTRLRVANLRSRKKQKDKYRDEQLELLREENELLRKKILEMRAEK